MDRAESFEAALKLAPGKTALLVVDMQRGFLDPGEAMEVPHARDIIPRIRGMMSRACGTSIASPGSRNPRCMSTTSSAVLPGASFSAASNDSARSIGGAPSDQPSPRLAFGCASNDPLSPRLAFGCASNDPLSPRLAFGCASNYHAATENALGLCRTAFTQ